jgi:hypothetical protein
VANATIDLHINPLIDSGDATASGFMINDDGLVVDPTDAFNNVTVDFAWSGTEMTISVNQIALATNGTDPTVCPNCVNMNDRLSSFIVH